MKTWYFLMCILCFFGALPVSAATLYMDPNTASLNRGDAVTLAVRLDTDEAAGECVNAISGVVTYSDSVIPVDVAVGKSIVPLWVEAPTINKAERTITFAGGIPNGYCGRVQGDPNLTNTILELVFRAPGIQVGGGEERTAASIQFGDATAVYLNDGMGTQASLQLFGTTLALSDNIGSEIIDTWRTDVQADEVPPEEFSVTLERDDKTFGGQYYIVFNTTDKQTGLSHYEVIEESAAESKLFSFGAATAPWVTTRSPYVLNDQTLRSVVRVRAIDKAGNEYVATLIPDSALRSGFMVTPLVLVGMSICIGTLIAAGLYFVYARRRARRTHQVVSESQEPSV